VRSVSNGKINAAQSAAGYERQVGRRRVVRSGRNRAGVSHDTAQQRASPVTLLSDPVEISVVAVLFCSRLLLLFLFVLVFPCLQLHEGHVDVGKVRIAGRTAIAVVGVGV